MSYQIETMREGFAKYHLNPDGAQPWPFRPVYHHLTTPDEGWPHDHPFDIDVYVVSGWYIERVWQQHNEGAWYYRDRKRQKGDAFTIDAEAIHEIIQISVGGCWTHAVYGPWKRHTRFWRFDAQGATSRQWDETEYQ